MWYTIKSWIFKKMGYPFEICIGTPIDSQRDLASFTINDTLFTIYIKKI